MDLPLTKPVCQLDGNNIFLHSTSADLDLYAGDGSYILPAGCIDTAPPELAENQVAQWQPETGIWLYLPDFRGQTVYDKTTGEAETVFEVGELPEHLTLIARPTEFHIWDNKKQTWKLDNAAKQHAEKAQFQAAQTAKLKELANAAQDFVIANTRTDIVPQFEQDTYALQGLEAKAWALDKNAETPVLDRIADERGVPRDVLKAAALRKTLWYEKVTASVAGQRQALQTRIEQAQTQADLDAILIAFVLPESETV